MSRSPSDFLIPSTKLNCQVVAFLFDSDFFYLSLIVNWKQEKGSFYFLSGIKNLKKSDLFKDFTV